MKKVTALRKAMKVLSFYRWAFGDLTESDSDVGILAEYLVGDILGCLPPTRKDQAPFDLVMKDGTISGEFMRDPALSEEDLIAKMV